jgi:hypothetical protein
MWRKRRKKHDRDPDQYWCWLGNAGNKLDLQDIIDRKAGFEFEYPRRYVKNWSIEFEAEIEPLIVEFTPILVATLGESPKTKHAKKKK